MNSKIISKLAQIANVKSLQVSSQSLRKHEGGRQVTGGGQNPSPHVHQKTFWPMWNRVKLWFEQNYDAKVPAWRQIFDANLRGCQGNGE